MRERTLKLVLAASLAGNLFLVGLIAGAQVLGERRDQKSPGRPDRLAAVVQRLDPEDGAALRALMRAKSEAVKPRVQALRAERRAVEAALGRPDYDPAAVQATLARVRAEETALMIDLDRTLLEFASRLEPEERAAMAPLLRKGGRGGRERRVEAAR